MHIDLLRFGLFLKMVWGQKGFGLENYTGQGGQGYAWWL